MTVEYEIEPIRGLPGNLPKGEHIVWQGTPDWQTFARSVFHTRLVALWFLFVASLAFVAGGTGVLGAAITLIVAALGLGLLGLLAWAGSRSTVYTLTNKRIVMRFGAAVPKCVNLPLAKIGAADIRPVGNGHVDIVLRPTERFPLGWLQAWPHVRPWKVASPQPMLRALPDSFVPTLSEALASADPARTTVESPASAVSPGMVAAA
ncbi:photosynthetic complex putative assembly protein PuhB [Polymorphobacter sp.]|uniref:photosynthetic complex putative assembly protein PuhB n=1 Tax=Polymorphobacter sp. TaxID=1909290 RepID=UPI003F7158ED